MNRSESINELAKALASFQMEVKQPPKNGKNPHFRSEYVTLDDTVKAINETAPKHGLSYLQQPINEEGGVGIITIILHTSGQYIEFPPFILPLDKKTAQGAGSAITYARRYSLSSAFGLVSDLDDDANEASETKQQDTHHKLSEAQVKRLFAIGKSIGVSPADIKKVIMSDYNKTDVADLTKQEYDEICSRMEAKKGA